MALNGVRFVSEYGFSGYGQAGRGYLRALIEQGVPVTWTPMLAGADWGMYLQPWDGGPIGDPDFDSCCNVPLEVDLTLVHLQPQYYRPWKKRIGSAPIAGLTTWETDQLPEERARQMNTLDLIMVPCQWNKALFEAQGVRVPIRVVPHIFSRPTAGEVAPFPVKLPERDFIFYSIGAWTERKAMYKTVEAYLDTFDVADPVLLVLQTSAVDLRRARYGRRWRLIGHHINSTRRAVHNLRRGRKGRIVLATQPVPQAELYGLHVRGDVYVSLTRGEGWGMGAYEAAFFENPVIMTAFGGQADFLDPDSAYLVDYEMTAARPTGVFEREIHRPNQSWAEPDLAQAAGWMREIFEDQAAAARRAAAQTTFLDAHFSSDQLAARLVEALQTIA
jgi:glycosyltransferase involved in cell wall biosynthesis